MELTERQISIWQQSGSDLSAPPDLCKQALLYYQQYKTGQNWSIQRSTLLMRVAYFLAQKSQVIYDRQGRRLKSIAISANVILRDHPRHQEFLYYLRQMVRSVQIPQGAEHLQEEVGVFCRQLSFCLAFLNKLRTTIRRIRVNRKGQQTMDQQTTIRIIWLVFVDCRAEYDLDTDIVESTCLLSCIFSHFVADKYKEEGVFSIFFQIDGEGGTLSNQIEEIQPYMASYFRIKDLSAYSLAQKRYKKYKDNLSKKTDVSRLFGSPYHKNIYILQKMYEKKINEYRIDESTFLKGAVTSVMPVRMTPFGRRGVLAPRQPQALSHRILSFENAEQTSQQSKNIEAKKDDKGLGYFTKLKLLPTPKGTLIRGTPMTEAMDLYNWLYMKGNQLTISKQDTNKIQHIFGVCSPGKDISIDHCQLIYGLYRQVQQKNEGIDSEALKFICVIAACHVLNSTTQDISIIMEKLSVEPEEIWKALDLLINFSKLMPLSLRIHLLSIETTFISKRLWSNVKVVSGLTEGTEGRQGRLVKRVLHHVVYTLHYMAGKLQMNEDIQQTSFLIFQQALISEDYLLYDRAVQHLLVCSLYSAARVRDQPVRFNDILLALKEALGLPAAQFDQLVQNVKVQDKTENIISFYNSTFVPALKNYLKLLRAPNSSELIAQSGLISSKLKELIQNDGNLASTPQMANYYAYSQSPMLKRKAMRDISGTSTNTARKQNNYGIQDIQAKFGKFGGNALRETRKIKH